MKQDLKIQFKALSVLLHYPGEDYFRQISEVESILSDMPPDEFKNSISEFITHIRTQSLIHLQETYTAAFDISTDTSMNLTYHIWGDNEKRAGLLTRIQQVYQDFDYERITGELPDYLPLMLEFLCLCPEEKAEKVIWECFQNFDTYITRLRPIAPLYSSLLQPLADLAVKHFESKRHSPQPQAEQKRQN
jgi:nitrate reductase delta subunit